jgi:hypothetical protein
MGFSLDWRVRAHRFPLRGSDLRGLFPSLWFARDHDISTQETRVEEGNKKDLKYFAAIAEALRLFSSPGKKRIFEFPERLAAIPGKSFRYAAMRTGKWSQS